MSNVIFNVIAIIITSFLIKWKEDTKSRPVGEFNSVLQASNTSVGHAMEANRLETLKGMLSADWDCSLHDYGVFTQIK